MSEISEDDLIVFRVLADRAAATGAGYITAKLADAVKQLLDEVKRLNESDLRARVRAIHDEIACTNCDHPAKAHDGGACTETISWFAATRPCGCDWRGGDLVVQLDEALNG